jgi:hypothetical protein
MNEKGQGNSKIKLTTGNVDQTKRMRGKHFC